MRVILDHEQASDQHLGQKGQAKEEKDLSCCTDDARKLCQKGFKREGDQKGRNQTREHPRSDEHFVAKHQNKSNHETGQVSFEDGEEGIP